MDWQKCCICQKITPEDLRCPYHSNNKKTVLTTYEDFLKRYKKLKEIESVPEGTTPYLQDVSAETMVDKQGQWHYNCHYQFNTTKVQRAVAGYKRKAESAHQHLPRKISPPLCSCCVLCLKEDDGTMHTVTCESTAENIRTMLSDLGDGEKSVRITNENLIARKARYCLSCLTDLRNRHRSHKGMGDAQLSTEPLLPNNATPEGRREEQDQTEEEDLILDKAVSILRKVMFAEENVPFNGILNSETSKNNTPMKFLKFAHQVLTGTKEGFEGNETARTITQVFKINAKKRVRPVSLCPRQRIASAEPTTPIYLGLKTHLHTRCKKLVQTMFHLGTSISYDRVVSVEKRMATAVAEQYRRDGVVVTSNARFGLVTGGGIDNIDHNPSSTTAESSYHGTGNSIMQHPTPTNPGVPRPRLTLPDKPGDCTLPNDYTSVPAYQLSSNPVIPPVVLREYSYNGPTWEEDQWLDHVNTTLFDEEQTQNWASFHSQNDDADRTPSIIGMLPLFDIKSTSSAMVKHSMYLHRKAAQFLNPGQTPFTFCDQPIYAIAKKIQWDCPEYAEDRHAVLLGGMHTELAVWSGVGTLLENSGWTNAIARAKITGPGTADANLNAAHLMRTR